MEPVLSSLVSRGGQVAARHGCDRVLWPVRSSGVAVRGCGRIEPVPISASFEFGGVIVVKLVVITTIVVVIGGVAI